MPARCVPTVLDHVIRGPHADASTESRRVYLHAVNDRTRGFKSLEVTLLPASPLPPPPHRERERERERETHAYLDTHTHTHTRAHYVSQANKITKKPESNQSGVAVENAKEFSDVSDFILNINNKKRVQKVWSNKQKVIIIVNSSALTYYLESVSSDNALFEFEDSSDLLQWLENCTDPWDTVESHWIRTAGTRLKLTMKSLYLPRQTFSPWNAMDNIPEDIKNLPTV
ncbi:hypothetical protein EVAR_59336_1 [Eumeta japonica]|uniref:Uncharacterized protein n=1 Tax=Eumeta variegata TaxID=151549 RepID=A0A4C1Z726_EUMVA|nr:hypothetical protein EVAR_59336_1 [Eumeta japonica]